MSGAAQPTTLEVGATLERTFGPLTRQQLVRYSGASGDFNPMHYDDDFARSAGFPSVFAQGMLSAGVLGTFVAEWLGPRNVRSLNVRFREQVWPGDELTCSGVVIASGDSEEGRTVTLELTAKRQTGGVAVTGTAAGLVPNEADATP